MHERELAKLVSVAAELTEKITNLNPQQDPRMEDPAYEAYLDALHILITAFPVLNKHYPLAQATIDAIDERRLVEVDFDSLLIIPYKNPT